MVDKEAWFSKNPAHCNVSSVLFLVLSVYMDIKKYQKVKRGRTIVLKYSTSK